mmetsp:Transcript_29125/g.93941  ORF Transcript_29125/g.93941 Transcript_29125/m.93941 type:complete len:124 (+) Transcript_29125:728-1099(+)
MRGNKGAIVNVASTAGLVGVPGIADYCASKHGIIGLTKAAAFEYAADGVRVNCVAPGGTDTDMVKTLKVADDVAPIVERATPAMIQRLATVDEIAAAIVWLLSDDASFITGAVLPVDGGCSAM